MDYLVSFAVIALLITFYRRGHRKDVIGQPLMRDHFRD